jgi:rhodanese-related sulfurtransferase
MSRLLQPLMPGLEIKPLIAELRERMEEELDYRDEAVNQRAFATAFDGDDKVCVPKVVASAPKAMVTEWVTGRKLSDVIREGTQAERNDAAALLAELHYSSPPRLGLLHADPHPGNFQLLDVRGPGEWNRGHIPGAQHFFLPQLREKSSTLDKSKPTAVYCASGYRASLAASILKQEGFTNVSNVPGSWHAWKKAGFPVEK